MEDNDKRGCDGLSPSERTAIKQLYRAGHDADHLAELYGVSLATIENLIGVQRKEVSEPAKQWDPPIPPKRHIKQVIQEPEPEANLTPMQRRFLDAYEKYGSVNKACKECGHSAKCHWTWRKHSATYRKEFANLQLQKQAELVNRQRELLRAYERLGNMTKALAECGYTNPRQLKAHYRYLRNSKMYRTRFLKFRDRWLPEVVELAGQGLSQDSIARILSKRSGRYVSQGRISDWLQFWKGLRHAGNEAAEGDSRTPGQGHNPTGVPVAGETLCEPCS